MLVERFWVFPKKFIYKDCRTVAQKKSVKNVITNKTSREGFSGKTLILAGHFHCVKINFSQNTCFKESSNIAGGKI